MFPIYTRLNYTVELIYYNYTYISWIMQYIWARFFTRNDSARNYSLYPPSQAQATNCGDRLQAPTFRLHSGQVLCWASVGKNGHGRNIEQGMPNDEQKITNIEVGIAAHRRLHSALPSVDFQHRADDGYTPRNKLG